MGCPSQSCREIVPLIPLTSISGSRCTAAAYPERSRSTARCWRSPRHSGLTALPCKTSNTEGLGLFGFWGIVCFYFTLLLQCCSFLLKIGGPNAHPLLYFPRNHSNKTTQFSRWFELCLSGTLSIGSLWAKCSPCSTSELPKWRNKNKGVLLNTSQCSNANRQKIPAASPPLFLPWQLSSGDNCSKRKNRHNLPKPTQTGV